MFPAYFYELTGNECQYFKTRQDIIKLPPNAEESPYFGIYFKGNVLCVCAIGKMTYILCLEKDKGEKYCRKEDCY